MEQIEKDVPMPDRKNTHWKSLAVQMEVGDSVLCASARKAAMLINALRHIEGRGVQRQENGRYRVWRVG